MITQGQALDITFAPPPGNSHLDAVATVTLTSLSSTSAVLDILISNDSSGDTGFTDRLVSFGFEMSPAPTPNGNVLITFVQGTDAFTHAKTPGHVPSINAENVCTFVGNTCSAGNAGIIAGLFDEFDLTLNGFYNLTGGLDLSNFGIKWTDCTGCSFEIPGDVDPPRTVNIPEPGTALLFGAGLLTLLVSARVHRHRRPIGQSTSQGGPPRRS